MQVKLGFKCKVCNDIVYNSKCFCGELEVLNKDNKYILLTDDPDFETYDVFVDNTNKVVRLHRNYYESLGKDLNYPDNFGLLKQFEKD